MIDKLFDFYASYQGFSAEDIFGMASSKSGKRNASYFATDMSLKIINCPALSSLKQWI